MTGVRLLGGIFTAVAIASDGERADGGFRDVPGVLEGALVC